MEHSKTQYKDLYRDNNTNALINTDDEGYRLAVAERKKSKTQSFLLNEISRLNQEIENQKQEIQFLKNEVIELKEELKNLAKLIIKGK